MKKHLQQLLLFMALCVPWMANAQQLSNYTYSTGVDASKWVQLSSTTSIIVGTGDSYASSLQNIGFAFPFGEESYTQFSVNSDGNLRLGGIVTGTGSYSTPFSSSNANTNSPKINMMGCDGYITDSGHVYAELIGTAPNRTLVVEFATSTYNSTSRPSLLRWQVQLSENGDITIAYPSSLPPILPAVTYQKGLCVDASDVILIDADHAVTAYTSGSSAACASGTWPDVNRYYSFVRPIVTCPRPQNLTFSNLLSSSVDISWTEVGSATSWVLEYDTVEFTPGAGQGTVVSVTDNPYSLSGLEPSTVYYCALHSDCGGGDTSFNRMASFRTPCIPFSSDDLPYTYGFEGITTSASTCVLDPCWSKGTNSSTAYPYGSSTAHTGSRSLYMYATSTYYSYAVLPLFEDDINTLQLGFWLRTSSSSYSGECRVGVMTNPADISTFTEIAVVSPSTVSTWEYKEIPLNRYVGDGGYLAIVNMNPSTSSNDIYVDDVTVDHLPNCIPVSNVRVEELATTSATIAWTPGAEESEWFVTLTPDSTGVFPTSVYDSVLYLTDLTPETNYTLSIQSVCGTDSATTVVTSFFTGYCQPSFSSVDYDGIINVSFGTGDTVVNKNITTMSPYYYNCFNEVGQLPAGVEANVNITFGTGYDYGTIIWVDWNNNLTFDGNEVVYVGESSDDNPTTLQASFFIPDTTPLGHYRMRIAAADSYFDSYTSSIAAAAAAPSCPHNVSYGTACDFTISVTEAPSCLPITNLQVHNVTNADSIYATWSSAGIAQEWDLVLSTTNAVPDEDAEYISAYDTSYLFEPLSTDSTYFLFVRSNCSGDVSTWSNPVSFRPGLYVMHAGSDTVSMCHGIISDDGGLNGSYSNNFDGTLVVLPASLDSTLRIFGTAYTESSIDYLKIYDGVGTQNLVWSTSSNSESETFGPIISNTGAFTIVFHSDGSVVYEGFSVNVSCVYMSDCVAPTQFASTYSNGDTVALAWGTNGNTNFDIAYGPMGFNVDEVADENIVSSSDSTYTFTGLPLGVSYDFYVRANCGSEQSFWIGPVTAMTGYFYAMHAGSDTLSNACGYIITDDGGISSPYSVSFDGTLVLLPESEGQTLVVSGTSYTEGSFDYLTIYDGVGTSGPVLFCDNTSGVSNTIPFGPFTSDEGAITIKFHSDGSNQYDGFAMSVQCVAMSSCTRPNQLVMNGVTDQDVTLDWNERGTATSWNLEYGPAGFTRGSEYGAVVTANTHPFTLTGLTPSTSYDIYLTADCGAEQSAPTAISFRTACSPIDSLPYAYGFEDASSATSSGVINPCWTKGVVNTTTAYPYPQSVSASGTKSLYFYGYYSSNVKSYAAMPMFEEDLAALQVSFKVRRSSSTYSYYCHNLTVGVMTDPTNISTFTPIETFEATSSSEWDQHTCYLAGYEGTGRYIAFLCAGKDATQYYNYIYLDDVVVDYAPECGPVSHLVAEAGPVSAIVTWTPNTVGVAQDYTVSYRIAGDEDWTDMTVSEPYAAITGLTIDTTYDVRVAANCTEGTSTWVYTTFSTRRCLSGGDIAMGNGTAQVSGVPVNSSWGNTICQSIFTADELHAQGLDAGPISSLKYTWTAGSSHNKEFTIRMGTTPQSLYADATFIPVSNQRVVYTGVHPSSTSGTVEYSFITPFVWDGTSNIVVTSYMNQYGGSQSSSGFYGYSTELNANRTVYGYQDSNPIDTTGTAPSYSYTSTSRPSVIFGAPCDPTNTCVAPVVAVVGVSSSSVDLVWAAGNTETSWNVYAKRASDANYSLASSNVTVNHFTVSNLYPGAVYQFKVEAGCSANAFSEVVATTECAGIIALPFTETFDSWGAGSGLIPNCWSREGSYSSYPYITTSTGAGYDHTSGTGHSLYMYTYGSSSAPTFVMLPEVDSTLGPVNQMQAVFYMNYPSTSSYVHAVIVGVCDATGISSFVPVDTVAISVAGTNNWEVFEVPLANYSGNGRFITLMGYAPSSYAYPYVDDLTIEYIPTCPRPDSLTASNATTSTVDFGWHERGGASNWIIEYGPVGFQLGTGTIVNATSNPFTLTGLPSSYDGEYYVRSVCSSSDTGDYSRRPCRFSTTQIPATLPYVYDFENVAEWNNWQTNSNNNVNFFRGTAAANDGQYSMYISADAGASVSTISGVTNVAAYRDIDFGPVDSSYTLTFKTKLGGSTNGRYDALMVFLVDPSTPVVASNTGITSPWGNVNDLYRVAMDYSDTNWHTVSASFDTIHGVHRVAFFWFNQTTASFVGEPAAIDSITIDYSACPRPVALDTVSVSAHSATLSWVGPANANYLFLYREYPNGTTLNTVNVSTNSVTLTNLPSATTYVCAVQKLCGSDSSLLSDAITFTTKCDVINAYDVYTEDFEGYSAATYSEEGDAPNCWLVYSNGTSAAYMPHVTNSGSYSYPHGGSGVLTLTSGSATYGDTKVAALPVFAEPVNTLTMKFFYRMENASYGTLTVGYVTDENDLDNSFVPVKTISSTETITQDSVSFDSVSASAVRIAFKWVHTSSYYSCGIDDIEVSSSTVVPSCHAPAITSATQTYEDITLNWSASNDTCEVAIAQGLWVEPTATTQVIGSTYTFAGLTPATTYNVGVRQHCAEGAVSDWTVVELTTDSLPCFAPEALSQTASTYRSVTLSWTAGGEESHWQVRVYNTTFDSIYDAATTTATVSGLQPGISYSAAVRALCGNSLLPGDWSEAITVTTADCQPVTNVRVTNVTAQAATITWTAGGSENAWVIEYSDMPDFATGTGTIVNAGSNPFDLPLAGFEPETEYYFYVYAQCDASLRSVASNRASFTTQNVGIDDVDATRSVSIYPNPATHAATLTLNGVDGQLHIDIVDMNGRKVQSLAAVADGGLTTTLDLSTLAQGAYFVRIYGDNFSSVKKLVVR